MCNQLIHEWEQLLSKKKNGLQTLSWCYDINMHLLYEPPEGFLHSKKVPCIVGSIRFNIW